MDHGTASISCCSLFDAKLVLQQILLEMTKIHAFSFPGVFPPLHWYTSTHYQKLQEHCLWVQLCSKFLTVSLSLNAIELGFRAGHKNQFALFSAVVCRQPVLSQPHICQGHANYLATHSVRGSKGRPERKVHLRVKRIGLSALTKPSNDVSVAWYGLALALDAITLRHGCQVVTGQPNDGLGLVECSQVSLD